MSEVACEAEQGITRAPVALPDAIFNHGNPLTGVPSILALRDLRRRMQVYLCDRSSAVRGQAWISMLRVDPLAVVRGLRVANAPVYAFRPERWTIQELAERLGSTLVPRLLNTPSLPIFDTGELRQLWLHAVATAHAARDLAAETGLLDPEEAYLLGLVQDLPAWLHQIDELRGLDALSTPASRAAWIRHWHLPPAIAAISLQPLQLPTAAMARPHDTISLLAAAARLAMLADYPHPGHLDARENLLAEAERAELIAAQKLRRSVQETLDRLGLGSAQSDDGGNSRHGLGDEDLLLPNPAIAPLEEVLLNVLSSRQSSSYRGIVTAMLGAALRYGTFDRVIYAKWVGGNRLVLRSKAESSARRMAVTAIAPTPEEATELRQALIYERPVLLDAEVGNDRGLLAMLATDQLLAVAVNREFETPAFLFFDRATRQLPIQLAGDSSLALTLGQTGSLLKENLLLRRRRERSDQVALTDPLTRLYNRRMAVGTIERELLRSVRSAKPVTVLLCDLDYFKRLNDQFGHLVGDFALRAVADVLRQTVRRSDILCRFGGEEFLIILPETPVEDATVLATRIFTQIAQRGDELNLPITVSIGLTMSRVDDTATTLLERADHALYASKGNGRNRFSVDIEGRDEILPTHQGAP